MESVFVSLFSSDVFKVTLGAIIGLAGTLIVTTMTYRIETAKMKANHRASIIKDTQLSVRNYFYSMTFLLERMEQSDKESIYNLTHFRSYLDELAIARKDMGQKVSQLKSIGLTQLARNASDSVEPMQIFISKYLNHERPDYAEVAHRLKSLEDVFLAAVNKEYEKLKL